MLRILIIGATSAVAQAAAMKWSEEGAKIFCIARDVEKMNELKKNLGETCAGSYCFDFKDLAEVKIALAAAITALQVIDIVLFAQGDLFNQLESETSFDVAAATFQVNTLSTIAFLLPITDRLIAQSSGKIGVITSVAGDRGRPRNYTYGAAKGALIIYLQGLRSRLWGTGVEVYTFKLGPVDSPMTRSHTKNFSFSSVDLVAEKILKAYRRSSYETYIPGYWFWVMKAVTFMPELLFQKLKFLSGR